MNGVNATRNIHMFPNMYIYKYIHTYTYITDMDTHWLVSFTPGSDAHFFEVLSLYGAHGTTLEYGPHAPHGATWAYWCHGPHAPHGALWARGTHRAHVAWWAAGGGPPAGTGLRPGPKQQEPRKNVWLKSLLQVLRDRSKYTYYFYTCVTSVLRSPYVVVWMISLYCWLLLQVIPSERSGYIDTTDIV